MARKRPHKGNNRRGSTKGPRKQRRTITGTLRVLRPGSAVVETPEGTFEVTRSGIREAMSGDEVSVFLVGPKGGRVASVVNELGGEKIDIVKYSEVPEEFIAAALAPSEVLEVTLLDEGKSCRVIVPDNQLSLAIGKEGQNARLAAKLTGYKIDIKPESEA